MARQKRKKKQTAPAAAAAPAGEEAPVSLATATAVKSLQLPLDLSSESNVVVVGFDAVEAAMDQPAAEVHRGVFVAPIAKWDGKTVATVQIDPQTTHGPFNLNQGCMVGRVFCAPEAGLKIKIEGEEFHHLQCNDYFAVPEGATYTVENTSVRDPAVLSLQLRPVLLQP